MQQIYADSRWFLSDSKVIQLRQLMLTRPHDPLANLLVLLSSGGHYVSKNHWVVQAYARTAYTAAIQMCNRARESQV